MKIILTAIIFVFFSLCTLSAQLHAQPAGGAPVNLTRDDRHAGSGLIVPPGYVRYKGCLVPKAALEAHQGSASRPAAVPPGYVVYKGVLVPKTDLVAQQSAGGHPQAGPRSEEEKRRMLLEQLHKYKAMAQARRLGSQ